MTASLESVPCPLCRAEGADPWATEDGYTALKCRTCGLVYVSPRPALETISEATRTGMHRTEQGTLEVTGSYRGVRVVLRRRLIRSLWPDLARAAAPIRWLDIGTGHGEMLLALRAVLAPGSDVQGVEPNDGKAEPLRRRGFTVAPALDGILGRFDVVSLMNVYGHLPDPVGFIRSLDGVLEATGDLIIETGNGAELASRSDYPDSLSLPDHLSFAGEPQLRRLLADAGYEVVTVHRRRVDGLGHLAQAIVRRVRGERSRITMPYRSPFRFLYVRCRPMRPGG